MTIRWLWGIGALVFVAAITPQSAFAQGDGPRTHWKGMLTDTNIFSLSQLNASGNTNPLDPAHMITPTADFDADLILLGYARTFELFGQTAVGSILAPFGDLEVEVAGTQDSTRGIGDPILQLDVNLIGAPAMRNMPELLRYEPDYTVDFVVTVAVPIGEYDDDSMINLGQNRWYGRVGVPIMINLGEWVPGSRKTLEFLPAVWFFEDNDDFLGKTLETDPLFQFETHLTSDFTEELWGSIDAIWYYGGESTIGGVTGEKLDELGLGFTFGYQINSNLMLTVGYVATVDDGPDDLDLGVFRINLIYGWHQLLEGIDRLNQ